MAGKEYTAKDKIFSKMTREGLTEETLRDGSVKKIGQKSRDEPELDSKERDEKNAAPGKRLSDSSGRTDNQRMRRYVQELRMSSDIASEERPARTFSKASSERIIEKKGQPVPGKASFSGTDSGSIRYLGSERSSKEETCSKETDRRTGKIG